MKEINVWWIDENGESNFKKFNNLSDAENYAANKRDYLELTLEWDYYYRHYYPDGRIRTWCNGKEI